MVQKTANLNHGSDDTAGNDTVAKRERDGFRLSYAVPKIR